MKILKAMDKIVNKVKYFRYRINLPKKVVEKSGLVNKSLKATTKDKRIIIEEDLGIIKKS